MDILFIVIILMAIFFLFIIVFIKNSSEPTEGTQTSHPKQNPFYDLRNLAFKSFMNNDTGEGNSPVYGIILDLHLGDVGIITLASHQRGDACMYSSSGGGGIIAGHQHEDVKEAVESYLNLGNTLWQTAAPIDLTDLPKPNSVNFYFLTSTGKFLKTEHLDNLENKTSELSKLYERANQVIKALRTVAEGQNPE